jgi:hypothetical protein
VKRRLAAAAIFVGILLLLLWISQPGAHAATQKPITHKRQPQPYFTVVLKESPIAGKSAEPSLQEGEVQWEPDYEGGGAEFSDLDPLWEAAVSYGYIGSIIGFLLLLGNLLEWRRGFVKIPLNP